MIFVYIILLIIIALVTFVISEIIKKNHSLQLLANLRRFKLHFENAISDFRLLRGDNQYISDRQYQLWKIRYVYLTEKINSKIFNYKKQDSFKDLILKFLGCFNEGRELHIDKSNNKWKVPQTLDTFPMCY